MNKIVYLQSNEKIARSFQEEFQKQGIEMLVVKSGEEALDILKKEKVLLLLLDINIPDMRFRMLVDKIRAISPQVIINVCIDVLDPLMITKLSNRHHVHKIYVAPWDIDVIVEEVKESIEVAIINEQVNVREEQINSEIEELGSTIESLKSTLKKQQHSYTKLTGLTSCFMEAINSSEDTTPKDKDRMHFVEDMYTSILKMQTTGAFDIDKFEEDIRKDLREFKGSTKNFEIGEVSSCLFAGQSRAYAQNVRFCIFMLTRFFTQFYDSVKLDISSHYLTTKEAEFEIIIEHDEKMKWGEALIYSDYLAFVEKVLDSMTVNFRSKEDGNVTTYYCTFPVAS